MMRSGSGSGSRSRSRRYSPRASGGGAARPTLREAAAGEARSRVDGPPPRPRSADGPRKYGDQPAEAIAKDAGAWSIAGRVLAIRSFGKAAFLRVRDAAGGLPGRGGKGKGCRGGRE